MVARSYLLLYLPLACLAALDAVPRAEAALLTSFQSAYQGGGPAAGWSYLWNSAGPIGNPASYAVLLPTPSGRYTSDGTDNSPRPNPAPFLGFGTQGTQQLPGAHPGPSASQNTSGGIGRYAIALYTVPVSDSISLLNGHLQNVNPNSGGSVDGVSVDVFLNDSATPLFSAATPAGFGSETSFGGHLGTLVAGDRIYVAIGSKDNDLFDSVALAYDIVTVPEPASLVLLLIAAGQVVRRRTRR